MDVTMIPVIISGGAGSRLWPLSREAYPKPFIKLPDGQSLLQKTVLRASQISGVKEILTVTNRDLFFQTQDQYRELDLPFPTSYILEPVGRNTAPAVASALLHLAKDYPEDTLL